MPLEFGSTFKKTFYDNVKKLKDEVSESVGYKQYKESSDKAEKISQESYPADTQWLGEGDAMRHILFSAMATKAYGSTKTPKTLSWLNENIKGRFEGADEKERQMDLDNDTIGREIGLKAKDEEEMIKMAKEAIASKRAKVIQKTPNEGETTEEMDARLDFENMKATLDESTKNKKDFGDRPDGSKKGQGFLGVRKRPDGNVSTEISISLDDVNGGKDFPLMVPTLTEKEVNTLLSLDEQSPDFFKKLPKSIVRKAVDHANKRIKEGKPVFAD
jgi:hypothetical protein